MAQALRRAEKTGAISAATGASSSCTRKPSDSRNTSAMCSSFSINSCSRSPLRLTERVLLASLPRRSRKLMLVAVTWTRVVSDLMHDGEELATL